MRMHGHGVDPEAAHTKPKRLKRRRSTLESDSSTVSGSSCDSRVSSSRPKSRASARHTAKYPQAETGDPETETRLLSNRSRSVRICKHRHHLITHVQHRGHSNLTES